MPKYTANAYLTKDGKIVQPGNDIELTKEQAARLGDKLQDAPGTESEGNEYTEASLKKLSAEEQKAIVEQKGGDLEEITNQDDRIDYILENQ